MIKVKGQDVTITDTITGGWDVYVSSQFAGFIRRQVDITGTWYAGMITGSPASQTSAIHGRRIEEVCREVACQWIDAQETKEREAMERDHEAVEKLRYEAGDLVHRDGVWIYNGPRGAGAGLDPADAILSDKEEDSGRDDE